MRASVCVKDIERRVYRVISRGCQKPVSPFAFCRDHERFFDIV